MDHGHRPRLRKLRIAAALRSSLSSCSSRNLSHSLPDSVFLPQPQPQPHANRTSIDDHLPDLSFLNSSNAGSCGIRSYVVKCASEMMLPRQISDRYSLSSAKEDSQHVLRCPPASPITPLNPFLRNRLTPTRAAEACESSSSSTSSSAAAGNFLSTSDDEGTSSECSSFSKIKTGKLHGRKVGESSSSYAVVKRSSDPYGDFRRSMVEMIVEKSMYGAGDLERLLEWFLRLNEGSHHAVILRAFTDIWESLHYL